MIDKQRQIYADGVGAYQHGNSPTACPYPPGPGSGRLRIAWLAGYYEEKERALSVELSKPRGSDE